MADTSRRSRFSLKIPLHYRARFRQPFNKFLRNLLSLSDDIDYTSQLMNSSSDITVTDYTDHKSVWQIWMNQDLKEEYLRAKARMNQRLTHAQFITVLLDRYEAGQNDAKQSRDPLNSFSLPPPIGLIDKHRSLSSKGSKVMKVGNLID